MLALKKRAVYRDKAIVVLAITAVIFLALAGAMLTGELAIALF